MSGRLPVVPHVLPQRRTRQPCRRYCALCTSKFHSRGCDLNYLLSENYRRITMDNGSLKPLAVVTGASSGIGYELARQFAQNNFDLFITADGPGITSAGEKLQA